jgi:uncharacterized protein
MEGKGGRIVVRLAPVLANGGVLGRMILPFKMGLGGRIGDGKQWFPWVSGEDVGRIFVDHIMGGKGGEGGKKIYNVISPGRVTNEQFTKALGSAVNRPTIVPMPGFVVKAAFGEMGEEVLLGGTTCEPGELEKEGYEWVHGDVNTALEWAVRE